MTFLEILAKIPSHFLAMLLGVTVFPARSLFYTGQIFLTTTLAIVLFGIGIPIAASYFMDAFGFHKVLNVLASIFVVVPVLAVIGVTAVAIAAFLLTLVALWDMGRVAWNGLRAGFTDGMLGFWEVNRNQTSPFTASFNFFINAPVTEMDFDGLEQLNNTNGFEPIFADFVNQQGFFAADDAIPEGLVDVEVRHEPGLTEREQRQTALNVLEANELTRADELLAAINARTTVIAPNLKIQFEAFKSKLDQYKNLSKRLDDVRTAITNNNFDDIEDELVTYGDVKIPIIVAQQYKKDNQWITVPTSSRVSCKEALLNWLRVNPTHPTSRENFKEPGAYRSPIDNNEYPSRYTWHKLTANYCYAQELGECANEIRELVVAVAPALEATNAVTASVGNSAHTMFANGGAGQPAANTDEINNSLAIISVN